MNAMLKNISICLLYMCVCICWCLPYFNLSHGICIFILVFTFVSLTFLLLLLAVTAPKIAIHTLKFPKPKTQGKNMQYEIILYVYFLYFILSFKIKLFINSFYTVSSHLMRIVLVWQICSMLCQNKYSVLNAYGTMQIRFATCIGTMRKGQVA